MRRRRRTLNGKFLFCLLAGAALFGVATHLLHAYQVRRNAGALLARADKAKEENQPRQEADYLRRYLGFHPDDTDALARYGLLLADDRLAATPAAQLHAVLVLEQVLRREPGRGDVRHKVVDLTIRAELYADAEHHLTVLLDEHPGDGELESLRGKCQEARGDYKKARGSYEDAVGHAPARTENYARLASLLRRHPDEVRGADETLAVLKEKADKAIRDMVDLNPRSFRAYLRRAEYYREFTRPRAEALKLIASDTERAQQLAPARADVLLALAGVELDRGEAGRARERLRAGCREHPRDRRMYQTLAGVEVRLGRPEAALASLRDGLKRVPEQDQGNLLWDLADLLVRQKSRKEEATEAIKRLKAFGVDEGALAFLDARLLVSEGNWSAAIRKLEGAYPRLEERSHVNKEGLFADLLRESGLLLGRCYDRLGDFDRAHAAYRRVVELDPRSVPARLGMAVACRNMGKLDKALVEYRRLMRLPDAPPDGWVEIARLELGRNQDLDQPRWSEVHAALDQAEDQVRPLPADVVLMRVEALAREKNYEEARARLLAHLVSSQPFVLPVAPRPETTAAALALGRARPPLVLWGALAALEDLQGRGAKALALLDRAEDLYGDHVELRAARARYWARRGGAEARSALTRLARDTEKFDEPGRSLLLSLLAQSSAQAGATDEARKLWFRLAQRRDDDLGSRLALLDLALRAGDDESALARIAEVRHIEGEEGALWRHAQVRLLLRQAARAQGRKERGDLLAEASRRLSVVASRRREWSQVSLCEAQIEDLSGHSEKALAKYQEAIKRGDRGPVALRRTVELLYDSQRYQEAADVLRTLPRGALFSGGLERVATRVYAQTQETDRALSLVEQAEKAILKGSKAYKDYLWLGGVYWAAKEPKKAEQMLRKARDLDESAPQTWVTLVLFLVNSGQKEKAQAEVLRAERKLPRDKAALPLAQCYQALGEREKAGKLFTAARAANPHDLDTLRGVALHYLQAGNLKEAQGPLAEITRSAEFKEKSPGAVDWARRTLALVVALGGDYQQKAQALRQLGDGGTADQRMRASILAMRRGRKERREAIGLLEDLIARRVDLPEDHLLLASLYEASGDWPRARRRFLSLTDLRGGQAALYRARCARAMLRHEELAEAERALARLEKVDPQGLTTKEIRARVLHKQDKTREAVRLLERCADAEGANRAAVARLLEEFGETAAAERMYRAFVNRSKEPTSVLVLVGFLGRQKRLEDALKLSERAWETCPPEAVSRVYVRALSEGAAGHGQMEAFGDRLQEALKKHPNSSALLADLGYLRVLQGRYKEAEDLYGRTIEKNPRDATALNNLAFLLALERGGPKALELVEAAFAVIGPHPALLDTQAVAYLATGEGQRAVKVLEEVVAEDPANAGYLFHLAQAQRKIGNRAASVRSFQKAVECGLTRDSLHPLERPAYDKLQGEFKVAGAGVRPPGRAGLPR